MGQGGETPRAAPPHNGMSTWGEGVSVRVLRAPWVRIASGVQARGKTY